jgi:hypothetical protein
VLWQAVWRERILRANLIAALLSLMATAAAWSFDYNRYQAVDLDEIIAKERPETGADILPGVAVQNDGHADLLRRTLQRGFPEEGHGHDVHSQG